MRSDMTEDRPACGAAVFVAGGRFHLKEDQDEVFDAGGECVRSATEPARPPDHCSLPGAPSGDGGGRVDETGQARRVLTAPQPRHRHRRPGGLRPQRPGEQLAALGPLDHHLGQQGPPPCRTPHTRTARRYWALRPPDAGRRPGDRRARSRTSAGNRTPVRSRGGRGRVLLLVRDGTGGPGQVLLVVRTGRAGSHRRAAGR
ncbi:MAG: hypothetical protein QOF44_5193 [Streptomyces sp.]|nr:hypothetical protein [Streptomyces sp.]